MEFKYPEATQIRSTASESVDGTRGRLSRNETGAAIGLTATSSLISNSPELIFTELQNLRKKYDAVVEYTVHLTAERDAIVSQLETSQRELVKEKSKKKPNTIAADGDNVINRSSEKKSSDKVFNFYFFFITIIYFCLCRDFLCLSFYSWHCCFS